MPSPKILMAPITHVVAQFNQNCHFEFDGAIFRSTAYLISLAESYKISNKDLVVPDSANLPSLIFASRLPAFVAKAQNALDSAYTSYVKDCTEARQQFQDLITPKFFDDEKAE